MQQLGLRENIILGLIILLGGGLFSVGATTYKQGELLTKKKIFETVSQSIKNDSDTLKKYFSNVEKDILLIAGGANPLTDRSDTTTTGQWQRQLQTISKTLLSHNPSYYRIRYLDINGNELSRVQTTASGGIKTASQDELQNKGTYDYFKKTLTLNSGGFYYSDISLNRENNVIEVPFKPVLRIGTPVFDDTGTVSGAVVFNIAANKLFEEIQSSVTDTKKYVLNSNGDFLSHHDPSKTFGFDLGMNYKINEAMPELSYDILTSSSNSSVVKHYGADKSLRAFTKIFFDRNDKSRYWTLIHELSDENAFGDLYKTTETMIVTGLAVTGFFILLIISFITKNLIYPIINLSEAAEMVSHGDLEVKVKTSPINDELGLLLKNFNNMTNQLYEDKIVE